MIHAEPEERENHRSKLLGGCLIMMRLLNAHGLPDKKEESERILDLIDKVDGEREREDGGAESDGNR